MLLLFSGYNFSQEQPKVVKPGYHPEVRTYFLKHITPRDVEKSLRYYFENLSADRNSNMFTVRIYKDKIPEFERLLKKIDVEKKKILFRIFTVVASNEGKGEEIRNQDLKKVLAELKSVLSFKSYKLDGASLITVKEGSDDNSLTLLTKLPHLALRLYGVKVKGDTVGKRTIDIRELRLHEYKNILIETETSIKENGYLVAGVSKVGKNGDALVLVINAEIK
jgi:hypothetical protein